MNNADDTVVLNSEDSELCDRMAVVTIRLSCQAQRVSMTNPLAVSKWGPIVPIAYKVYYSVPARQLTSLDRLTKRATDDWLANLNKGLCNSRWAVCSAVQCDVSCRIVRMP